MKRPAFQFYPDNWRNNSNLRRCSWAARGVWVEVMCLMHDADQYGALAWSIKEIAQALGCPVSLLRELAAKGVMKGCDHGECEPYIYTPRSGRRDGDAITLIGRQAGPFWYSSRMVRDEYVRSIRGEGTRYSTQESPSEPSPKASPKPPIGEAPKATPNHRQGDGSSSSTPTSYRDNSLRSLSLPRAKRAAKSSHPDFPDFWAAYPRKVGRGAAEKAFAAAVAKGASVADIATGLNRQAWPDDPRFIPHPATWLNQARWQDDPTAAAPPAAEPPSKIDWLIRDMATDQDGFPDFNAPPLRLVQ